VEEYREKNVHPEDCVFAFCLPLTKEEFFTQLNRGQSGDFLSAFFRNREYLGEREKWNAYEPTAKLAHTVSKFIEHSGACVLYQPASAEFGRKTKQTQVSILFAHWRSSAILPEDIYWEELLCRLSQIGDDIDWIAQLKSLVKSKPSKRMETICNYLNSVLLEGALGDLPQFGLQPNQRKSAPEHRMQLNREILDGIFPGAFAGTTSIQFGGGLVPVRQLKGMTDRGYSGTVDLSVCNCGSLAEQIKADSPASTVIGTDLPVNIDFRLLYYRRLFRLLQGGGPYVRSSTNLRIQLLKLQGEA